MTILELIKKSGVELPEKLEVDKLYYSLTNLLSQEAKEANAIHLGYNQAIDDFTKALDRNIEIDTKELGLKLLNFKWSYLHDVFFCRADAPAIGDLDACIELAKALASNIDKFVKVKRKERE